MLVTTRLSLFVVGLGLCVAAPSFAQTAIAHLSQVEGTVTRWHRFASASARPNSGELRRDHAVAADGREGGPAAATVGMVLVEGDQIVTAVGRAELTFVDGSLMHLDQHTQVVIAGAARVRLIDGRVSLRTTTAYTAETSSGIVHVLPQGIFELTANATNRDVLVQVVEGDARIESQSGVEAVTSTQTAFVSGPTGRSFVSAFVQGQRDSFVLWCNSRYVAIAPPPTFLPYAHPTYRQSAFQRTLRKDRHHRDAADVQVRGDRRRDRTARPADRGERTESDAPPRRERPVATSASARETSSERRRDRAGATSGREGGPAPQPKPVRAATAGKAVRPR